MVVLEVHKNGAPKVLVSSVSENRLFFDNAGIGNCFVPGEFVQLKIESNDILFIGAEAINKIGLRQLQEFAARYGLSYRKGIQQHCEC